MTAIHPDLEAALAAADAAGARLFLADPAAVKLAAGWADIPAPHRAALAAHRPAVLALLAAHPRPAPDPVWFVRRNLAVYEVPASMAGMTSGMVTRRSVVSRPAP